MREGKSEGGCGRVGGMEGETKDAKSMCEIGSDSVYI